MKSNFVYSRINHSPLVGHFMFLFFCFVLFFVRKNPSSCDCAEIRTHFPTSEGFVVTNLTTWAKQSCFCHLCGLYAGLALYQVPDIVLNWHALYTVTCFMRNEFYAGGFGLAPRNIK